MISVRFLGTAGARFMVAKQIRASGGIWFHFSGEAGSTQIHVDPGPGALVRATTAVPPCDPTQLDAIALSHKHLDHSGDVNVMIEAMTVGGFRPRGALLAPRDAFEGEAVIFPYAARFVPTRHVLEERSGPYHVNDVEDPHVDRAPARRANVRAAFPARRQNRFVSSMRSFLRRARRRLRDARTGRTHRQRLTLSRLDESRPLELR